MVQIWRQNRTLIPYQILLYRSSSQSKLNVNNKFKYLDTTSKQEPATSTGQSVPDQATADKVNMWYLYLLVA